jgi:hypothetical protein
MVVRRPCGRRRACCPVSKMYGAGLRRYSVSAGLARMNGLVMNRVASR